MLKFLLEKIRNFSDAVLERFGLDHVRDNVLLRRVAKTPWYHGDGASLILLLSIQILTGLVLTLSYSNSPATAHESVKFISETQMLGWFVRGLHYWSAGLMIIMLLFHLFRLIMVGGYKAPREGTWLVGVFLFVLIWIMAFSGYTLRWDERALYAMKVLLTILHHVPLIGEELVVLLQGGQEISAMTLSRMYSLHVILIPGAIMALVALHMYLVILHGVTSAIEREVEVKTSEEQKEVYEKAASSKEQGEDFYPVTMAASGSMAFVVFLVAIVLTFTLGAPELGSIASFTTDAFPREEWWFAWYSGAVAILPRSIVPLFLVWFPVLIFFFLISIPFIDRSPNRGLSARPGWVALVAFATIILVGLTAYRMKSPWTGWPSDEIVKVSSERIMTDEQQYGRKLFTQYGCTSCHAVEGSGREVAVDITRINHLMTKKEIQNYILSPPEGVSMPPYKGRLSAEELRALVEFVHVFQIQPAGIE